MSKTRSIHHIVFATARREMTITEQYKKELYAYIYGIIKNNKCHLIRMNGIPNHIHILVDIHPSVALATLVKEIKQWSSHWMKTNPHFSCFDRWCEGYYAMSLGVNGIDACKEYIINQEVHHSGTDLLAEMEFIADENGLAWFPDDWA